MPLLNVYSTNGQSRREILIPGRSAMRQFGAIQIVNNVGQRQESDWPAIRAAIAAGNVVICLTAYEADVLPQHIEGTFPFGGNVRFDCKKNPKWRIKPDEDSAFGHFEALDYQCEHCGEDFPNSFHLNGHLLRQHRGIADREKILAET